MEFYELNGPNRASANQIAFIDRLIAKEIFNDILFEETTLSLHVKLDSPVQAFYRLLWETLYLKRKPVARPLDHDNKTIIMMSLSECIQYLQAIQSYIDKMEIYKDYRTTIAPKIDLTTVSGIIESMNNVLRSVNNSDYPYYITKFHEIFHLDMWQNNWTPNYAKISVAREFIDDPILAIIEASAMKTSEIMKLDKPFADNAYIQITFHVDTLYDMIELYRLIGNNDLKLTGVQCNDIGLFVSAYSARICAPIAKLVGDIYGQLQAINNQ